MKYGGNAIIFIYSHIWKKSDNKLIDMANQSIRLGISGISPLESIAISQFSDM